MAEHSTRLTSRVLFLDDNNDMREACVTLIEAKFGPNIEITQVITADAALDYLEVVTPNLIISDISHPGTMSGVQFFVRVRQDPALRHIPFVFLSANTPDRWYEVLYQSDLRPPEGFIVKPFRPFEFLAQISGYLPGARDVRV